MVSNYTALRAGQGSDGTAASSVSGRLLTCLSSPACTRLVEPSKAKDLVAGTASPLRRLLLSHRTTALILPQRHTDALKLSTILAGEAIYELHWRFSLIGYLRNFCRLYMERREAAEKEALRIAKDLEPDPEPCASESETWVSLDREGVKAMVSKKDGAHHAAAFPRPPSPSRVPRLKSTLLYTPSLCVRSGEDGREARRDEDVHAASAGGRRGAHLFLCLRPCE